MSTKTIPKFRVGDRVRRNDIPNGRPGMPGMVFEIALDSDDFHVTYGRWSNWVEGCDLTLVERAHYAPDGVPMLALPTPVLDALLRFCDMPGQPEAAGKAAFILRHEIFAAQDQAAS